MKKTVVVAVGALSLALLLTSCAGIPKPEGENDTLVVGSFILDYPDGFYNQAPRAITSGVRLDFMNTTQGTEFFLLTSSGGYFSFLTNGTDSYDLKGFSYYVEERTGHYTGSGGLTYKFSVSPHAVQYIGHLVYTFSKPRFQENTGLHTLTWNFERALARTKKVEDVARYLGDAAKDSVWVSYEVKADFED